MHQGQREGSPASGRSLWQDDATSSGACRFAVALQRRLDDRCRQTLQWHSMSRSPSQFHRFEGKRAAGRPRFFDADQLKEVWLFVEKGRSKCNLSVNAFCSPQRTFTWLQYQMSSETRKYELRPVQSVRQDFAKTVLRSLRSVTKSGPAECAIPGGNAAVPAKAARRRRALGTRGILAG
jgi:hypothetical protein